MKHEKLKPQLAVVFGYAKTIGQGGHPVSHLFVCVRDHALSELVLAFQNEIDNTAHAVVGQQRFFVQMHDPVGFAQLINVILQAVLQSSGLWRKEQEVNKSCQILFSIVQYPL